MCLSHFLKRVICCVLSVVIPAIIISDLVFAKPFDPAPISDEVVQKVVRAPREGKPNPVPEILSRHLDEASGLLDQVEKSDQGEMDPARQAASLGSHRMFLQSEIHQLTALRAEVRSQFAQTRAKLVSLGLTDKVLAWDALLAQVENRFDRINRALDAVLTAKDKPDRAKALAKAKSELWELHGKVKEQERPPITTPPPTFRQDVPTDKKPDPETAAPPQYIASATVPQDIYAGRHVFFGKTLLVSSPPSTPPQAQTCNYTSSDLAQNQEVQITSEIQDLAGQLGYSPVKIYQYVSNNIKFEPYYGSLKGAMGTLVSGAGNATDQASLLIALLRASNIPARYVKGTAQFKDERLQRWVGAKTYKAAGYILLQGLIPASYLGASWESATGLYLTHVWVEACVPYGNYRGTGVDLTGFRWIPLDPSFKEKTYQAGITTNVDFDYTTYLSTRTDTLPHEKYEEQVEAYIKTVAPNFSNNTLQDVGYVGTQVPRNVDILPASLPYEVTSFTAWTTGGTAETAEVPDTHRYKFNISPQNGTTLTLSMPNVALKRITLSFKGADANNQTILDGWNGDFMTPVVANVVPVMKVEGVDQNVATNGYTQLGSYTQLGLTMTLADYSTTNPVNSVTYINIRAGGYDALQGYAFQASDRLLKERGTQLLNAVRATPNDKDATQGEFLHLAGLKYMRYITDAAKTIGELDGGSGLSGNHIGLTSSDLKVQYLFDLPFAVFPGELLVDVLGGRSRSVDLFSGNLVWKTFLLTGYTASAYEHYIWQENARLDAVSTVRGIQFASQTGIEVLILTSTNWASQKCKFTNTCSNSALNTNNPALNYDSSVVNSIEVNYINLGFTVTIPRSKIQYQNWKGYVFVAEENNLPNSMTASFSINGSYNGGYTVGTVVPISVDYNVPDPTVTAPYNPTTLNTGTNFFITFDGDPVNMATGNMYHTERDIFIKGRGLPLVFERSYNSRTPQDGPLGFGWTHSFNHYLVFKDDNMNGVTDAADTDNLTSSVSWFDGTGGQKYFKVTGGSGGVAVGSVFTNPPGIFVKVSRNTNGTYTITEKNGLIYTFQNIAGTVGQKANLLSIKDRNGNTLTLGYSGGLLTSVTDGLGRSLTFTYTGSRISQVKDWTNRTYQYGYDANGNLISYKNPLAVAGTQPPVTYSYYSDAQLNHVLKSYTLPKGNGMTFEYYMNGKVFKHYDTLGETVTFTYNEFRRETVTVNERGYTRKFLFDKDGNPTQIIEENGAERTYAYNDLMNPMNRTSKTDPMGYLTQYAYDTNGNVTKITNPSGSTVAFSYFNSFNQPGKIKDANGNYTLLKYDANGNLLQRIMLKSGIGAAVDPTTYVPAPSEIVSWTITTYDSYGNPLVVKQVRNFTTQVGPTVEYNYNDTVNNVVGLNAVTATRFGDKNGDGVIDRTTEFDTASLSYDALGRTTAGIRSDWQATQAVYDAVDRVIKATDGVGQLRDYSYDANGNPAGEVLTITDNGVPTREDQTAAIFDFSDRKIIALDAGGNVTSFQYDTTGNVVKITNPDGYTLGFDYDPNNHAIKAYDQEGHAVARTLDLDGKPRSVTDPNGNTTQYEYYGPEREGRLKKRTDPLSHATQFDYDGNGNVTIVTDPLGRTTTTTYDEMNRPVRIVGPAYTDATFGLIRPVTRYAYDNLGNLITVSAGRTDSSGTNPSSDVLTPQMTYAYDDFGRKIKETDPLGRSSSFVYDTFGNPTRVTDAKGQVTTRTYDYGHLLHTQTDNNNNLTNYTRNALGQVLQAETPDIVMAYAYDTAHRLSSVADRRGGKLLNYRYSPGGLLNNITDTENHQTNYLYDPVGRLTGIWASNGDLVSFVYDAGGRLTEKSFPNGVNTRYSYNKDNTVSQVVNRKQAGTIVTQNDYTYDALGNRLTNNEMIGSITTPYKYVYNELNRLTEVRNNTTNALIEGYSYDPLGNRKTKTDGINTVAYVYDAANQLKEIHQGSDTGSLLDSLVYDLNGSLISKDAGTTTLTYDALNRLVQVSKTGQPTQNYVYDDQARRIKKTVGSAVTQYLYNGPDIVAEYGASWTTASATYTQGPSMDSPIIRATATATQYYHQDGLGSVVGVSDQTGATTGTVRYDAWGGALATTGIIPQYGYTGREPDETGLVYYRARYYDPGTGRFTQKDPIGMNGGMNLYAYVGNNPINRIDPDGQLAFFWHFGISFVAGLNSGYGVIDSLTLAYYAARADFQPAAFSNSAEATAQHGGMIGVLPSGINESPEQAETNYQNFIAESSTNPTNFEALGQGLHSTQDYAADWHAGQPWPPVVPEPQEDKSIFGTIIAETWHFVRDIVPIGAISEAYNNSIQLLQDAQANGTMELSNLESLDDSTVSAPYAGIEESSLGRTK